MRTTAHIGQPMHVVQGFFPTAFNFEPPARIILNVCGVHSGCMKWALHHAQSHSSTSLKTLQVAFISVCMGPVLLVECHGKCRTLRRPTTGWRRRGGRCWGSPAEGRRPRGAPAGRTVPKQATPAALRRCSGMLASCQTTAAAAAAMAPVSVLVRAGKPGLASCETDTLIHHARSLLDAELTLDGGVTRGADMPLP